VLSDRDRRVLADVVSMNPDTLSGELHQLLEKHGPLEPEVPGWTPVEAPLPDLPDPHPDLIPDRRPPGPRSRRRTSRPNSRDRPAAGRDRGRAARPLGSVSG